MSLPVSQYEDLLAEVRGLRRKAQRVQQLANPLLQGESSTFGAYTVTNTDHLQHDVASEPLDYTMESLIHSRNGRAKQSANFDREAAVSVEGDTTCSEDEYYNIRKSSTKMSVSSEPVSSKRNIPSSLYHGTWPVEKNMWNSEPINLAHANGHKNSDVILEQQIEVNSVMSFASSSGGVPLDRVLGSPERGKWSSQNLEAKIDVVHSLLSMLGSQDHIDMGETLLALSTCPESCLAMRQSGCIPLLVQLVQSDRDAGTRKKAAQALHNLVNLQPDEKLRKRESRVLKLLEHCRAYTETLHNNVEDENQKSNISSEDDDIHPVQTVAHLMKLSFDEGHRQAICQLGGIHTIASLVEVEHTKHGGAAIDSHCILLRRYACMALTNLTFGDSGNKALLCSYREFMRALVIHLQNPSDELRQVTASVLRNLSWRADSTSKEILREIGSVTGLMKAAMLDNKENTLKSILSALWNLSAHCTENKSEICAVEGALGFLVDMLSYKTPTKSLAIVENSGGILRNISSQIAVRDDYREVLRNHNCLQILLDQLKSPSLTIVSNACGTLWNLSAKCAVDQEILWQLGAPSMLRSLNHSKHKMIAMGSSAALKNLLTARPQQSIPQQLDSTALSLDLPSLPTLGARKQKALMQDLDQNLSETYDNIEKDSPVKKNSKDNSVIDFMQDSRRKMSCNTFEYSDDSLANNFSSLNLNEPSISYVPDYRSNPRVIQNYGSSSLPYMPPPIVRTNPCSYISIRNKFSDCGFDDEINATDQPIDYSRKYSETKLTSNQISNVSNKKESDFPFKQEDKESFGIYAETDLDQPTDYSLRYAEDDSDSDICAKIDKGEPQEYLQDTLKTYCTEDTPYETPFNFSTATSMSDLRVDEKQVIDNDKVKESPPHNNKENQEKNDEKERCSTEDIPELEHKNKCSDKIPKSELSSGLMSPEKPVNYCEEGTPGYFSRVSSFGSLNSIPPNETLKDEKNTETLSEDKGNDSVSKETEKTNAKITTETKAVKFERVVNYAEQTPLMFSRSSSLASLDSIDQHSIHDDRSSVVSDLSRLTSGIVSPSELPDSPTQTVPPSPKPRKTSIEFPSTSKSKSFEGRPQLVGRTLHKPSVFEDNVTKFKEENTPVQFSTATSLSSLTIDDHEEAVGQVSQSNISDDKIDNTTEAEVEGTEKKDPEKEGSSSDINDVFAADSEDDGDEDILAACINIGMQTNRVNQAKCPLQFPTIPQSKLPISNYKFNVKGIVGSSIPLPRHSNQKPTLVHGSSNHSLVQQDLESRSYSTKDSMTSLSRTGSNSDRHFEEHGKKGDYLSDDSSNLSGDNDNILAECIQSGMPKAKQTSPTPNLKLPSTSCLPRRNNIQPDTNKYVLTSSTSNSRKEANKLNVDSEKRAGRREQSLPPYLTAGDELENYAVENSPCHFSLRSSLSDLTVDGSIAGLKKQPAVSNDQQQYPENSERVTQQCGVANSQGEMTSEKQRRESLSSLSVESLGSVEAEQALLEQCISSGKPKSNSVSPTNNLESSSVDIGKRMGKHQSKDQQDAELESNKSKNVNAASVAGSTAIQASEACPDLLPTAVTGVESIPDLDTGTRTTECQDLIQKEVAKIETPIEKSTENPTDIFQDRYSPIEEISFKEIMRNGFNNSFSEVADQTYDNLAIEERLARSCEESKKVDNRMLDPDAMIESLDRFTAELVSQASHLNKDDDKCRMSTTDGTWNDDSSPNEVTFPSLSVSAPNVITFSNEEDDSSKVEEDLVDGLKEPEPSNDFSSINTSTMTDSTLIAIEASKMATVFMNEAEMSVSLNSGASLELDHVQPPSNLNSLTNSAIGLPRSPKLIARKKSLPASLMAKKALSNSLNCGSSLESLENQSLLDNINPPSDLLLDMETSVESLHHEHIKTDFLINGVVNKDFQNTQHPIFNIKQPFTSSSYGCNDIENINPPSLFNEITDFCNSLADVNTDIIYSEICEDIASPDAVTLADETVTLNHDESTEQSVTPLHSNQSSVESTPKKQKHMSKSMMTKQRRILARERFKTYTIAAEMVMRDSIPKETEDNVIEVSQDEFTSTTPKENLSPRQKRQLNRSRFETQVITEGVFASNLPQPLTPPPTPPSMVYDSCSSSPAQSPVRTKLSIRRNFLQKRLENKERFQTQTLSESSFSPGGSVDSPPSSAEVNIHFQLQKEANLVLKTLHATKSSNDELLDCETLSLVSNDDDSEHNSASSVNYRTYHKSWGITQTNIPVIATVSSEFNNTDVVTNVSSEEPQDTVSSDESLGENDAIIAKPKIVKPHETTSEEAPIQESPKAIRGRRKPLYSKSNLSNKITPKNIRPVKNVSSNLVTNVSSNFKPTNGLKPNKTLQTKTALSKSPVVQNKTANTNYNRSSPQYGSPKTSPARGSNTRNSPKPTPTGIGKLTNPTSKESPPLERQGTFTKDETNPTSDKKPTKIPTPSTTRIPTFTSKVTMRNSSKSSSVSESSAPASKPPTPRNSYIKSASIDKTSRNSRIYNRSTSADSRDTTASKLQSSHSSHSLKSDSKVQYGAVKKSNVPTLAQRSNSNSSINSNGSVNAKKQVTSKIASLWKKIEDTKKQPPKKDGKKWIQSEPIPEPTPLIRSNTFENKSGVILRDAAQKDENSSKRVSRLGSFVIVDGEDPITFQQSTNNPVSVANVM